METTPKNFTFQINSAKTIEGYYFFPHRDLNKDSGKINLFIYFDDFDKPNVSYLTVAVPESVVDEPEEEIDRIVKSELAVFYCVDGAASK